MQEFYTGPYDALPFFETEEQQDFLKNPGSVLKVPPQEYPTVYPMVIKSHAIVPIDNLHLKKVHEIEEGTEVGYLIEHLVTGLHYFIYAENDSYRAKGILDFQGSKEKPYDIALTGEEYRRWHRSALDVTGTRIGGIPLNSDGTPYSGLWPYLMDGRRLSFLAQYQVKDGRYIHIFIGHDFDEYDYTVMGDDYYEDPFACAVLEGGPVPEWIQMKSWQQEGLALVHPNDAYTLKRHNQEILPAPEWIQDDYTPGTGEYEFLIQIGNTDSLQDEMDFAWLGHGDLYIFADFETDRVKAIMQDS